MNDPQVIDAILALAAWCEQQGIAFIHLAEADWDDAPAVPQHFVTRCARPSAAP
ncbi:hypothetical protein LNO36_11530 [Klebsiella variicola subsp. variicola]|nr:hypothetical protein [Klebsiella variicola subsp. variicola]